MRNWNKVQKDHGWAKASHVFILPMRNWNLRNVESMPPLDVRFHLTYEELKPISLCAVHNPPTVFILPMRNWNWRSYRNRYQSWVVFILPMRNWNFCTSPPHMGNFRFVFILPMRNWNDEAKKIRDKFFPFSSYLWGIETSWVNRRPSGHGRVFILPMRNWNFFSMYE